MKKIAILVTLVFCITLAGCNQPAPSQGGEPSQEPAGTASPLPTERPSASISPAEEPTGPAPSADETTEPTGLTPAEGEQTATLYVGTKANGFTEYPMTYEGELTPEVLIQGIADLTGWNLTLAEPVISGKGGMSVCLSNESSLFTGPPEPQKDEFHMFSADELAETILDSIQKTLQEGFVLDPGDPNTLDIWYYMEGEQPLELPSLGLSWAIDQPYQWAEAKRS